MKNYIQIEYQGGRRDDDGIWWDLFKAEMVEGGKIIEESISGPDVLTREIMEYLEFKFPANPEGDCFTIPWTAIASDEEDLFGVKMDSGTGRIEYLR